EQPRPVDGALPYRRTPRGRNDAQLRGPRAMSTQKKLDIFHDGGASPLDLLGPLTVLRTLGPGWPVETVVGERIARLGTDTGAWRNLARGAPGSRRSRSASHRPIAC